ncbi:hypothetical protein ACH5RR_032118, partial [Cinchona calisaya]
DWIALKAIERAEKIPWQVLSVVEAKLAAISAMSTKQRRKKEAVFKNSTYGFLKVDGASKTVSDNYIRELTGGKKIKASSVLEACPSMLLAQCSGASSLPHQGVGGYFKGKGCDLEGFGWSFSILYLDLDLNRSMLGHVPLPLSIRVPPKGTNTVIHWFPAKDEEEIIRDNMRCFTSEVVEVDRKDIPATTAGDVTKHFGQQGFDDN